MPVSRGAVFTGSAYFEKTEFSGNADFEEAAFSGNASFRETGFSRVANFNGAAKTGSGGSELQARQLSGVLTKQDNTQKLD